MFKTIKENRKDAATCFGHLDFGHWVLFRVSYLDIRNSSAILDRINRIYMIFPILLISYFRSLAQTWIQ